jgi:hypothetical protein
MPAYITSPATQQVNALYPGNTLKLVNNAATDSGITKTLQFAVGSDPMGNYRLTLNNGTNQTATVQQAATDADANYQNYSDEGTAITVSTDTAKTFYCAGPWVRCTFSSAPTTGSLTVSR